MPLVFVDAKSASLFTSVLLVSHDAESLRGWAHSLSQCSPYYNILKASTAPEAIELLRLPLDCVVLDFELPDSCFKVLQRIIPDHHSPALAVVVLTGAPAKTIHSLGFGNGVGVCISKASLGPRSLDGFVNDAISCIRKRRLQDTKLKGTYH